MHSLDSGRLATFEVDEATLHSAVMRTVDGVARLVALQLGLRSPEVVPNPACRWCCARHDCPGAAAWGEGDHDAD